ncbi:transketolase C-terminal domain-containing protein [Micromonospora tulbaghiae]|uniref:alpha-ketoacid dehydrogenase subunit beta n=1 Tax=Micromonospora tulbaghiae TaxID=479978 RepID=UPI0033CE14F4
MVDALNSALHGLLADDESVVLLGEDIADPYGGAFRATRGLSSAYPDRVISTPISENAIAGVAGGLALCGDRAIVEVMFGDFIALCFDPIINFISKSVGMFGRPVPMRVVFRCPVGGNRGYGPTHSQSPQKHFVGVPHLALYELSAFHDPRPIFDEMLNSGTPAIFFEDKVLYTEAAHLDGSWDGLFRSRSVGPDATWARVGLDEDAPPDWAIVAPGGMASRALAAMRRALLELELTCELLIPSKLYPVPLDPVLSRLAAAGRVMVIEDGVAGGGWGAEVSRLLYESLWGRLRHPVRLLQSPCAVIPAASHLERGHLIQESTIYSALAE